MEMKMSVIGVITKQPVLEKKDESTSFVRLNLAVNKSKNETSFVTAFLYGVSEKRAALMTEGSMVYVSGNFSDSIYENTITHEKSINRVINVKDFEFVYMKK